MNEREFCYWLQGFFEVGNPKQLSPEQTQIIKDHLALLFTKVTPNDSVTWVSAYGNSSHGDSDHHYIGDARTEVTGPRC